MGSILNVFTKISELPPSEMLSAVKEFAGEQGARGIIGLVNNMERLGEVLAVVNDENKNFGSVLKEFLKISDTTAAKIQRLWNEIRTLAIALGDEFLPKVVQGIDALGGFVKWVAWLNEKIPTNVKLFIGIGLAIASIAVPLALVVGGFVVLVKGLGLTLAGIAAIAQPILAIIGGLMLLRGVIWLVWKAGEFVVDALKVGFDNFGKFIVEAIPNAFVSAWNAVKESAGNFLKDLAVQFQDWINQIIESFKNMFKEIGKGSSKMSPSTGGSQKVNAYNEGGYVSGSNSGQLAVVGDGGGEYIVPANKVSGFMRNYSQGLRNQAALPSSRDSGLSVNPSVNVQTGPVMSIQGENYVTVVDLENALNSFAGSLYKNSRSYGGRKYQGVI